MIAARAKVLFLDVLEVEPEKRAALLDERCGEDRELRRRVEDLLTAYSTRNAQLDAPPRAVVRER